MLDQAFYTYMITQFNTRHTQDMFDFKGNYVYARINDTMTMLQTSTYNAYDKTEEPYYALAEVISQEIPFAESNNRSGWTKQFAIQFPLRDKDTVLAGLQEVRDWFLAQSTHTITDGTDTYKFVMKVSRPQFVEVNGTGGKLFATYVMQIGADSVETGFYGNEQTVKIAKAGDTLQDVIIDNLTLSCGVATDPKNILTAEQDTTNAIISRGISMVVDIYYDSTSVLENLYKQINGANSREQGYVIQHIFDGITTTFAGTVANGSVVFQKGNIVKLNLTFVEV